MKCLDSKFGREEHDSTNMLKKLANIPYQIALYPHLLAEWLAVANGANH